MLLPSAADLVRAFVKDLGNVLDSGAPADVAETTLLLTTGAGVARKWTADRDYFVTGWSSATAGASYAVISLSGLNATDVFTARTEVGSVWGCLNTALVNNVMNRRLFLGKGTVLTVFNGAASAYPLVIYMVPA
jgi:hypothetical protein